MEKSINTRQSGSAATLTGRGAGSVGQRYDVAILLPDPSQLQDPQVVPSQAMMERKRKVARRVGGSAGYRIWQPSQDPREVFRALGITVEDSSTAQRLRSQVNGAVARKLENLGGYIVTWPRGDNRLPFLRDTFRADFAVARDYRMFQAGQPDDGDGPAGPERNPWPETSGIGTARTMLVNGRSINFGVVDTGLDADHSEFVGRIVPFAYVPNWGDEPVCQGRRGFDPSRHGTHISSIIAGREVGIAPGGGLSVAGLAEGPGASITTTTLRRLLLGLDWLYSTFLTRNDQGQAFILNFSLGFPEEAPRGQDPDEYARAIVSLETVIHALADDNMLIIAAIGNDGEGRYRLPAGLLNVIGVGAVDRDGKRIMRLSGSVAPGRPGRAGPDLVGFGQGVLGADGRHFSGENLYARWSGTSQASAYVSGIAGLYWSMNRRMPAADVRALLMDTAMRAPRGEDPKRWGHGLARFSPPLELVRRFKAE